VLLIVSAGPSVVPRLIGLPLPVAEKRLRGEGMKLRFRAVPSEVTPGVVVATEPEPGEPAPPGGTVTVSVSSGPGRGSVPSLLGARAEEARGRARRAGFVARVFEVPSTEPGGIVVAQSPQPGAKLNRGSRVRIDVSTGAADESLSRTVDVPSVVGGTLAAAQHELESRGLVVRVAYALAGAPLSQVLKQDPPAGTTARRGANVRITVSAGREPSDRLEVIELVGLLEDSATSAIETAGFAPRVRQERTPDPAEVGVVVRQEPEAHTQAPQGGPITIYVGAPSG
jgi:serine/threonine-protein kinase